MNDRGVGGDGDDEDYDHCDHHHHNHQTIHMQTAQYRQFSLIIYCLFHMITAAVFVVFLCWCVE